MITLTEALAKGKNELAMAIYLSETATNAGLRVIYENKAELLSQLITAASKYQELLDYLR